MNAVTMAFDKNSVQAFDTCTMVELCSILQNHNRENCFQQVHYHFLFNYGNVTYGPGYLSFYNFHSNLLRTFNRISWI